MAVVACSKTCLLFGLRKDICLFDTSQNVKSILNIPPLSNSDNNDNKADDSDKGSDGDKTNKDEKTKTKERPGKKLAVPESTIVCAAFSPSADAIVCCVNDKRVLVARRRPIGENSFSWGWDEENWPIRFSPRRCVKVIWTLGGDILVADRSGDVYRISSEPSVAMETSKKPANGEEDTGKFELFFGRLSMLLDMILDKNEEYLIVADRDEKISVARYPNSYNIQSFCLGHKQFVTCVVLLPTLEYCMASCGGDGCIIVWRYTTGEILQSIDCWSILEENGINLEETRGPKDNKPPLEKLVVYDDTLVCLVNRVPRFLAFRITKVESGVDLTLAQCVSLDAAASEAAFDATGTLLHCVTSAGVQAFRRNANGNFEEDKSNYVAMELTTGFKKELSDSNNLRNQELETMYKTWYDNVTLYQKRKIERHKRKTLKWSMKKLRTE